MQFIEAIKPQDCLEAILLKDNLVSKLTATALSQYISKKGQRLCKIDLSMNRGIPQDVRL